MRLLGVDFHRPHFIEGIAAFVIVFLALIYAEQLAVEFSTSPQEVFGFAVALVTGALLRACGLGMWSIHHLAVLIGITSVCSLLTLGLAQLWF